MNVSLGSHSSILLTVDVEDWFQVENFKPVIKENNWDNLESRVERNVNRLLNLFDSTQSGNNSSAKSGEVESIKVTFFILGWVARRFPKLIREIYSRGHEIASHGLSHRMCTDIPLKELRIDLKESKKIIEDIIGDRVRGYRAPSFSITDESLEILKEVGYLYDSSYNSFALNERYGKLSIKHLKRSGIVFKIADSFYEIPISNYSFSNKIIPWGGGAYFRIIPFSLFLWGVRKILKKEGAYMFYLHPWEIDETQPRVENISVNRRIRHYTNLRKTYHRLEQLIQLNSSSSFITCAEYLRLLSLH